MYIGMGYKVSFGSNIPKWVILGNNYFMPGECFILMKMQKHELGASISHLITEVKQL